MEPKLFENRSPTEWSIDNTKYKVDFSHEKIDNNSIQQLNTLKNNIEKPNNYGKSFVEYLQEYPQTLQKIESYLQEPETIETWSWKIEKIWWEFAFWALSPELQEKIQQEPALLQNMKTGLSLYFTDWLNGLSTWQIKEVAQVWSWINGLLSKASDLMGIFKHLTSFKEQMSAITHITEWMDIYTKELCWDPNKQISQNEAFQSPEWFVRLLKKHTLSPWNQRPEHIGTFEDYFDIQQQWQINSAQIIEKLATSYGDNAHKLMTKVSILWPKILESRSTLKSTFGGLYDQVSQIISMFHDGKPLSEVIKWSWFEKPLNFIASILWFGSLSRYESRNNIKDLNKKAPESQKAGLLQAIEYMKNNPSDTVGKEFSAVFDNLDTQWYTDHKITKEEIYQQLPSEEILKKAITTSLESDQSFFINPWIFQKLYNNGNESFRNSEQYYTQDKEWNTILNAEKLSDYKSFIDKNLNEICSAVWLGKDGLVQPEQITNMIQEGKGKQEIANYLLSWLVFFTGVDIKKEEWNIKNKNNEDEFLSLWSHITREEAIAKYGKTAAVRNFNPGNIMDTSFGWSKIKGERFTRFESPQEWFQALINKIKNIQAWGSKIYKPTMTLKEYMYKYAPPHENNTNQYIKEITEHLNITPTTHIKDIDAIELAHAHAKKEDGKSYNMLKDLWIIT